MYTFFIRILDHLLLVFAVFLLMIFNTHLFLYFALFFSFIRLVLSIKNESFTMKLINSVHFITLLFILITNMQIIYSKLVSIVLLIISIILIVDLKIISYKNKEFFRRLTKFIFNTFSLILIVLSLALSFITIYPKTLYILGTTLLGGTVNEPRESYISTSNYLIHKSITYPSSYDNNVLDIYQTKNPKATIFFVHGGGYAVYDKSHREDYLMRYLERGYNVVNINYSLFPKTAYPDTTKQVLDAYNFTMKNAEIFGIDKNKIILSGDSAGGQLAGQLALLLTNKDYAQRMGLEINSPIKPLAFVGVATMLDPASANQTNFAPINWLFDTGLRDYFDADNLATSEQAKEASILLSANSNFPATFISDGNLASFDYQAKEFDEKLKSLGVESKLYLIETNNILQHGFELDVDNNYAQDVFEKQIEFMDKQ